MYVFCLCACFLKLLTAWKRPSPTAPTTLQKYQSVNELAMPSSWSNIVCTVSSNGDAFLMPRRCLKGLCATSRWLSLSTELQLHAHLSISRIGEGKNDLNEVVEDEKYVYDDTNPDISTNIHLKFWVLEGPFITLRQLSICALTTNGHIIPRAGKSKRREPINTKSLVTAFDQPI